MDTFIPCLSNKWCPSTLLSLQQVLGSHTLRAGFIPYKIVEGKVWLLLGHVRAYGWSDFGGGCKKEETVLQCADAELEEESSDLLYVNDINQIKLAILTGQKHVHQTILFIEMNNASFELPRSFVPNVEVDTLKWFGYNELFRGEIVFADAIRSIIPILPYMESEFLRLVS